MLRCAQQTAKSMRLVAFIEESLHVRGSVRHGETAGESVKLRNGARSDRRDSTGIHSAAEIRAERNVAHELTGDGGLESLAQSASPLGERAAVDRLVREVPVLMFLDPAVVHQKIVAGLEQM